MYMITFVGKLQSGSKVAICYTCFFSKNAIDIVFWLTLYLIFLFSFKSDRVLLRHKLTHNDEKLFACEICGKKFSNKLRLNDHGKVHSDELPFECEFCKKLFKRKSYLKVFYIL